MSVRPARLAAAVALAVVALFGAACSAGPPPPPPPPPGAAAAPPPPGGAPAPAEPSAAPSGANAAGASDQIGQAHQAALGLVALGALGTQKGSEALKGVADQVTTEGRAVDDKIKAMATAGGLTLSDDLGAQIQGVLNDLQARSGQPFDQGWLTAVGNMITQARTAANGVLDDPNASADAKAAAQDALTRLAALESSLKDASGKAGAGTPSSVNAGTGGQAAEEPVLPAALVGLGALLLGTAVVLRRRRV